MNHYLGVQRTDEEGLYANRSSGVRDSDEREVREWRGYVKTDFSLSEVQTLNGSNLRIRWNSLSRGRFNY